MRRPRVRKTDRKLHNWTPEEEDLVRAHYPSQLALKVVSSMYIPRHSAASIMKKAGELGLRRRGKRNKLALLPTILWQTLLEGPGTPKELIKRMGRTTVRESHVYNTLKDFHRARVIYIRRWIYVDGCHMWVPVYDVGRDNTDAAKPKPTGRTKNEYTKELAALKGNPFAGLILESQREHTQPAEDVHTRRPHHRRTRGTTPL